MRLVFWGKTIIVDVKISCKRARVGDESVFCSFPCSVTESRLKFVWYCGGLSELAHGKFFWIANQKHIFQFPTKEGLRGGNRVFCSLTLWRQWSILPKLPNSSKRAETFVLWFKWFSCEKDPFEFVFHRLLRQSARNIQGLSSNLCCLFLFWMFLQEHTISCCQGVYCTYACICQRSHVHEYWQHFTFHGGCPLFSPRHSVEAQTLCTRNCVVLYVRMYADHWFVEVVFLVTVGDTTFHPTKTNSWLFYPIYMHCSGKQEDGCLRKCCFAKPPVCYFLGQGEQSNSWLFCRHPLV